MIDWDDVILSRIRKSRNHIQKWKENSWGALRTNAKKQLAGTRIVRNDFIANLYKERKRNAFRKWQWFDIDSKKFDLIRMIMTAFQIVTIYRIQLIIFIELIRYNFKSTFGFKLLLPFPVWYRSEHSNSHLWNKNVKYFFK